MIKRFAWVFAAAGLAACSAGVLPSAENTPQPNIKRVWMLADFEGFSREQLVAAEARMDWRQLPRVYAYMGCNQLMMEAKQTGGDRMVFSNGTSTRMYCAETIPLEYSFMNYVAGTKSYRIEGHTLILRNDAGKEARFVAQDWD
ncbi:META domain-containing protein [Neisseria montereyensis]|uniref:META domain-containing protein n=1 Tax=Neisseria montereyensis TaxID=2973938 RepID=A0ABT2FAG0_9NEIS|nr:META domain-containing protein [Neisseria montereyensis]MCS4532936.1 META domain-containing protein [Neisseria montereyensis]